MTVQRIMCETCAELSKCLAIQTSAFPKDCQSYPCKNDVGVREYCGNNLRCDICPMGDHTTFLWRLRKSYLRGRQLGRADTCLYFSDLSENS